MPTENHFIPQILEAITGVVCTEAETRGTVLNMSNVFMDIHEAYIFDENVRRSVDYLEQYIRGLYPILNSRL